jgi:hypothetical protein
VDEQKIKTDALIFPYSRQQAIQDGILKDVAVLSHMMPEED